MFKMLILQASHSFSDERTEFLIKDRLSFMRFLELGLSDPVPDANTIWTFREALIWAEIAGKPVIAVPAFGYRNHVGIDRRHGLIRTWTATDAARHDGAQLPGLGSKANTAGDVWADTAYRSKAYEAHLAAHGVRFRIHCKKPPGKPMARNVARANGGKSKVHAAVEHVFARQNGPMRLVVHTLGLARARVKIGLANLAYNMNRAVWLTGSRTRTT